MSHAIDVLVEELNAIVEEIEQIKYMQQMHLKQIKRLSEELDENIEMQIEMELALNKITNEKSPR